MMAGRPLAASPALHFLVLGAFAFAWLAPAPEGTEGAVSEEEILVREALALGLDRGERIVSKRLEELAAFLEVESAPGALEGRARELGLQRSDPVIRRHLATQMRGLLSALDPGDWPDESDLEAHLAEHAEALATPARVRLTHVFLSRDRRGAATAADAAALLAELVAGHTPPGEARGQGDPLGRGSPTLLASASELDGSFGPGFGAAVAALPLGSWSGPLRSSYGLHLVWLHERLPRSVPPLAEVRGRVLQRVLAARRAERLDERLAALRRRYGMAATTL